MSAWWFIWPLFNLLQYIKNAFPSLLYVVASCTFSPYLPERYLGAVAESGFTEDLLFVVLRWIE